MTERAEIAQAADTAAAEWVKNPTAPKPQNPYDAVLQPHMHAAWRAGFERSLLAHSAPEGEGSA